MALKAYENMAACVIEEPEKEKYGGLLLRGPKGSGGSGMQPGGKGAAVSWGGSETIKELGV